jgi:NADPH:quinone reductase-like Zn-dependent oxidoreductase
MRAYLIEAGKVTSVIDKIYPLNEVAQAHRYMEKGHASGKVIIKIRKTMSNKKNNLEVSF